MSENIRRIRELEAAPREVVELRGFEPNAAEWDRWEAVLNRHAGSRTRELENALGLLRGHVKDDEGWRIINDALSLSHQVAADEAGPEDQVARR